MAELAAALAALSGKAGTPASAATPTPLSPGALGAHTSWFVPPHLLRLPAVRTAAFTAHDCSREAVAHPTDFDKVYRYGLSLQVSCSTPNRHGDARRSLALPWCRHVACACCCPPYPPRGSTCCPTLAPHMPGATLACLLGLQELASKLPQQPADQLALLHQAAEVYMEGSRLQSGQHAAALCEPARLPARLPAGRPACLPAK